MCGPIYTIADIFEDPQFAAREMLIPHQDPEFGEYIGPGIVPKLSETPGEVRWSATWEEGSHNDEIYGELLGLSDDRARRAARGGRRCDARSPSATSPPATACRTTRPPLPRHARRARQPARRRRRCPRSRWRQLRQPEARAADGRRRGGRRRHRAPARASPTRARRSTSAAMTALADAAWTRCTSRSRPPRRFNQRNQNATVEESLGRRARSSRARTATGAASRSTSPPSFGCPFEGAVDPARVLERRRAGASSAGADEIVFADTIGVGVPGQVRGARRPRASTLGVPIGVHLHNTRSTGLANAYAALEAGVSALDASVGRRRRLPVRARGDGNIATEDLVYLLHGEGVRRGSIWTPSSGCRTGWPSRLGHDIPGRVQRAGDFTAVSRRRLGAGAAATRRQ